MRPDSKKHLYLPIAVIAAYLIFTLILYEAGPFKWVTYHPLRFWSFQILYIAALLYGWMIGTRASVPDHQWEDWDNKRVANIITPHITINFVYELINAHRRFSITSFDLKKLIKSILSGASSMGSAYSAFQSGVDQTSSGALGGTAVTLFNLCWAFLAFNVLILGFIHFRNLSKYSKIVQILTTGLIIGEYLGTGTNIGVFRVILIFVILYLIRVIRKNRASLSAGSRTKKRNNTYKVFIFAAGAAVFVLVLFSRIMQSRGGILLWQSNTYNVGGIYLNKNSVFFKILPSGLYILLIALSGYLCQGYYGMSLCMRVPWEPGLGIGHSMALMKLFDRFSSISHDSSYQFRIAELFGWEEGVRWHSMYSWIANDLTFWGVIPIMFFIGMLYAMAYKDAVVTNNPYAKVVTYYFTLLSIFIPCNNQLFQSTYTYFAFVFALILWLGTRGRKQFRIVLGRRNYWRKVAKTEQNTAC